MSSIDRERCPIKVLAISNFGEMVGGGEFSFFDLISSLDNCFSPVVVVPNSGALVKRFRKINIPTRVIPLSKIRPWLLPRVFKCIRCLKKIGEKTNTSLIYANGSRPAFYGGIVGRILKIPVIWHCRITKKDQLLDSILSRLADLIIVNSQATAKRFADQLQSKIRVVYNGIDIQWLQDKKVCKAHIQAPYSKIILVVARASKWKRHDLALSAFEKVAEVYTDTHLVLTGAKNPLEQDWWDNLQKKTVGSMYSERIHWIGYVDDVRPWYRAASILLLPSENEAFGRVIVEAMACGVPVVATNSGGIPEIVRHGKDGILVPMGNSHELAEAIKRLLADKTTRTKMGKSAEARAEKFGLEAHIEKIIHTFERVIELNNTSKHNQLSKISVPGSR